MTDTQSQSTSAEEKFNSVIKLRCTLWETIISEAKLDSEIKKQLTEILHKFRAGGLTAWRDLDDAFNQTVDSVMNITQVWQSEKNNPELKALIQNLREDILNLRAELTA